MRQTARCLSHRSRKIRVQSQQAMLKREKAWGTGMFGSFQQRGVESGGASGNHGQSA